ncbi:LOW QUALITY PROTEIN: hypothetical protein Cgig2_010819 [Carnegiea gigantea]|uniref:Uncharacterized protein n=1 Tax=Carnegiea gigantea TaxID=171969 RepID=A0A9Q1GHC5_9CARY|nr:LOW QUALITY PROTEIN: hypothetical protein Cgig2_010819 [Carnegiea gigantea]
MTYDHTPILLQFPSSPKSRLMFQYCEIKHKDFADIITAHGHITCNSPMHSFCKYLNLVRTPFGRMNKEHFSNLKDQQLNTQVIISGHNKRKRPGTSIFRSSLLYGDDSTRLFYGKAKQRKLSSYIYTLKDQEGGLVEGFEQVSHTMFHFHRNLLGEQSSTRSPIDMEVIAQDNVLTSEQ